jgi:hypothetical protein
VALANAEGHLRVKVQLPVLTLGVHPLLTSWITWVVGGSALSFATASEEV